MTKHKKVKAWVVVDADGCIVSARQTREAARFIRMPHQRVFPAEIRILPNRKAR